MAEKIFLTGVSGNIGSQLVRQLAKKNLSYLAGLTTPPEQEVGFPYTIMNFADKASMLRAFAGVDTLFLLIPIVDPMMQFAKDALAAAKEAGVKHIVRTSAGGADLNSDYQLLRLHGEIDDRLKQSGINFTITQPKSFMQNFVNFFAHNIKEGTVYSPTGTGKSAWVDTRDIAAVNAEIIAKPHEFINQTFVISGEASFSIPEGLQQIGKAIGKDIKYVSVSQEMANQTLKSYGMSDFVIKMLASIDLGTKEGAMASLSPDVEQILGRPPISFQQFIDDHLSAWQ